MSESKQTKRTKTYYRKVNTNSGLAAPQKSDQANNHNQVAASSRRSVISQADSILNPKESEVMKQLKFYLDRRFGVMGWAHIPNEFAVSLSGGLRSKKKYINSLIAQGVKTGFPDILIFDRGGKERVWDGESAISLGVVGMAIEVKREKGGKLSQGQKEYLDYFESIGWATAVGYGYQDAINKIEKVYGKE